MSDATAGEPPDVATLAASHADRQPHRAISLPYQPAEIQDRAVGVQLVIVLVQAGYAAQVDHVARLRPPQAQAMSRAPEQ